MAPIFDFRKQLEKYLLLTLLLTSFSYGVWRAYSLITGPHITITYPHDNDTVSSSTFKISGRVSSVKNISIQGRSIPIDKEGNFNEILVAMSPYTIITLHATDAYGKTITKVLRVVPSQ